MAQSADLLSHGQRWYRIDAVLGRGGFGTVYRATLLSDDGFAKVVAIKLLRQADPSENTLARFRDEAKILGMLRDPHIASIDRPVRIGDRWAVIMDYVDGVNTRVLAERAPLPPQIALKIVEIVAATLSRVHTARDLDGEPMHLVHRDLKPSNVQVTPSGHVVLLDFGVARAESDFREARTHDQVAGTPGFIAPERFEGVEGPSADVYGLGVLMHVLLTQRMPGSELPAADPALAEALTLSGRMRRPDPADRPAMALVASECEALLARLEPVSLSAWAARNVPAAPPSEEGESQEDELIGQLLTENLPPSHVDVSAAALTTSLSPLAGAVIGGTTVFGVGIATLSVLIAATVFAWTLSLPTPAPAPTSTPTQASTARPPTEGSLDPSDPPSPASTASNATISDVTASDTTASNATASNATASSAFASSAALPSGSTDRAPTIASPAGPASTASALAPRPATARSAARPKAESPPCEPCQLRYGKVKVSGDATAVQLNCGGETFPIGRAPAGECDIVAQFGDAPAVIAGRVQVLAQREVAVVCRGGFDRCVAR